MISGYLYSKILTEIVAFVLCRNFFFTSGLVDGNSNVSRFDDEKQITWKSYSKKIAVLNLEKRELKIYYIQNFGSHFTKN